MGTVNEYLVAFPGSLDKRYLASRDGEMRPETVSRFPVC
jgi:hypothetical protein